MLNGDYNFDNKLTRNHSRTCPTNARDVQHKKVPRESDFSCLLASHKTGSFIRGFCGFRALAGERFFFFTPFHFPFPIDGILLCTLWLQINGKSIGLTFCDYFSIKIILSQWNVGKLLSRGEFSCKLSPSSVVAEENENEPPIVKCNEVPCNELCSHIKPDIALLKPQCASSASFKVINPSTKGNQRKRKEGWTFMDHFTFYESC